MHKILLRSTFGTNWRWPQKQTKAPFLQKIITGSLHIVLGIAWTLFQQNGNIQKHNLEHKKCKSLPIVTSTLHWKAFQIMHYFSLHTQKKIKHLHKNTSLWKKEKKWLMLSPFSFVHFLSLKLLQLLFCMHFRWQIPFEMNPKSSFKSKLEAKGTKWPKNTRMFHKLIFYFRPLFDGLYLGLFVLTISSAFVFLAWDDGFFICKWLIEVWSVLHYKQYFFV